MKPKRSLSNSDRKQIRSLLDQAARAFGNGRYEICEQICKKIESIQATNPDAANLRGILCNRSGQFDKAVQYLQQAIEISPKRIEFQINLAGIYLARKQNEEALHWYKQALQLDAKSPHAQLGCGNALIELGLNSEAIEYLEQASKRQPEDLAVLIRLYHACYNLRRTEEARSYLDAILAKDPNHAEAHYSMGQLALEQGRMEEVEPEIRIALANKPDYINAFAMLAEIKKFTSEDDPDIEEMIAVHARSAPVSDERLTMSFCLGKVMDKLKQHDRAFEYYREGNDIRHKRSTYKEDLELPHLQQIIDAYEPKVFTHTSELQVATPIFILGMPRCGSTLTEQILASHPDVASEGEWGFFEQNLTSFSTENDPLTLEKMVSQTPQQWRDIGQAFLDRMSADHPDALHITDKSLNNIRFVGAIHCAMPKAKIIHVRRSPLDTCLSIYKSNLGGHLFDFGYNLEELGQYYLMYLKLMQHWREVLPEGVMYELDYESLVANQEEETRKLLGACGLEWNDQCLQFNKAKNIVRTTSITQVRRPIYSDSLAAWKRY
ncbi:MAG TPA: sulfotransferase, partial [Mariprofundaceae bacterium]|nr:sulfotransferase [Mariprofundaceae bacterium]